SNNSRTVWPDQTAVAVRDIFFNQDHILSWDTFCDANDNLYSRLSSFHNRIGSKSWRNENNRHISTCLFYRILNCIKYRPAKMLLPSFSGGHTANNLCSVFNHL